MAGDAAFNLRLGDENPYDAADEQKRPMPKATDWAHRAARGIVAELSDRRGVKNGFNSINHEFRVEIVQAMRSIILEAHKQGV